MGLEVETTCSHAGHSHAVKALLEATTLILRGGLKKSFALADLGAVSASPSGLSFMAAGEAYTLSLNPAVAATWARKITTPPPSLAQKLGLSPTARAWVFGEVADETLEAALAGHRAQSPGQAACGLAVLRSAEELAALLKAQRSSALPLWLANVKGPKSPLGENAIRSALRAAGFKDVKTSAVSPSLSATRYVKPAKPEQPISPGHQS